MRRNRSISEGVPHLVAEVGQHPRRVHSPPACRRIGGESPESGQQLGVTSGVEYGLHAGTLCCIEKILDAAKKITGGRV
jgi:hypothetical protein